MKINGKKTLVLLLGIIIVAVLVIADLKPNLFVFSIPGVKMKPIDFSRYTEKILLLILLFIIFKIIIYVVSNIILKNFFTGDDGQRRYLGIVKLSNFVLWILFIFVAISMLSGNAMGLLTSLGLLGFGLTFALQKPIMNFVGWSTLLIKGTYTIGDRIQVGDSIRGDVKEIQLMNTVLDSLLENSDIPSGKVTTFPNELILTTDIQNFTKNSNFIRIDISVGITYENDYNKTLKILKDVAEKEIFKYKDNYILYRKKVYNNPIVQFKKKKETLTTEEIEKELIPLMRVNLLDSAVEVTAQCIIPYDQILTIRTNIFVAFMDIIQNEDNIDIAYPHLHIIQ